MTKKRNLKIHTDGGSRGNPGPSAIGFVIEEQGVRTYACGKPIGVGTNNQAEYEAVAESLRYIIENYTEKGKKVTLKYFLDSLLIVQQLKGIYKIKHPELRLRAFVINGLIVQVGGEVDFVHIPRSENRQADALVNEALDTGKEISLQQ
jgi:ribonuclease HI